MILEVEYGLNDTDDDQTIDNIEYRKKYDHQSRGLEEDA
jgi:hypothetical protein